jgi:endonuclease YncB( thermonuclease family)
MRTVIVLATMLLSCQFCLAGSKKTYGNVRATVIEVHDGDTLKVNISKWPPVVGSAILVRVYGVDCRELKTGATVAKDAAKKWIPPNSEVWLLDIRRDKYFRLLADVGFDCGNMAQPSTCNRLSAQLIEEHLAVPYFGETKKSFPNNIQ